MNAFPENAPAEYPRTREPDIHPPREAVAIPLSNELVEHVIATQREIHKLLRDATSTKPGRVYVGNASGMTDANGNIQISCEDIPVGFRAYVARVVIEIAGSNAGNPLSTANAWIGLYELAAGQTGAIDVSTGAGQRIGGLLDFSPAPDNTRVLPAVFENGVDASPVVRGGFSFGVVGVLAAANANKQVSVKYKLIFQET